MAFRIRRESRDSILNSGMLWPLLFNVYLNIGLSFCVPQERSTLNLTVAGIFLLAVCICYTAYRKLNQRRQIALNARRAAERLANAIADSPDNCGESWHMDRQAASRPDRCAYRNLIRICKNLHATIYRPRRAMPTVYLRISPTRAFDIAHGRITARNPLDPLNIPSSTCYSVDGLAPPPEQIANAVLQLHHDPSLFNRWKKQAANGPAVAVGVAPDRAIFDDVPIGQIRLQPGRLFPVGISRPPEPQCVTDWPWWEAPTEPATQITDPTAPPEPPVDNQKN